MAKKGSKKKSKQRPPVVVVLGHIDHGKTSLLSKIREEAMPKEAGEITQSIGAYQAQYSNQRITFIDTPGHRAFSSMRSRGAKGADVAVLVVAANEGPKAQTKEAAKIAQKAGVPLILAWNKMDLSSAKPSRFNNKIKDLNLSKSLSVEVSAKTGQGIDELLEAILLQAQEMDLPFKKGGLPKFTILESQVHPQKGILLDIVLKQGEIVLGQEVDGFEGAVRKILDFTGSPVKKVLPGMPARLMGLKEVSEKKVAQKTQSESREDQLSIIVKANSQGALQALVYSLEGKEKINLLDSGLGPISEKDLLKLKSGDWAVGFQVGIESSARNLAERKQINLETYKVIYDLLKDAQKQAQQIGKKEEKKSVKKWEKWKL